MPESIFVFLKPEPGLFGGYVDSPDPFVVGKMVGTVVIDPSGKIFMFPPIHPSLLQSEIGSEPTTDIQSDNLADSPTEGKPVLHIITVGGKGRFLRQRIIF